MKIRFFSLVIIVLFFLSACSLNNLSEQNKNARTNNELKFSEIGTQYDTIDAQIQSTLGGIYVIGGKLAYIAEKDGKKFMVHDGNELGKEYGYAFIEEVEDVGGKLAYIAQTNRWGGNFSVIYDGKEIDRFDGNILPHFEGLNGKILYWGSKNGKYSLFYNGQEIGKNYDGVSGMLLLDKELIGKLQPQSSFHIGNKIAFIGFKNSKAIFNYDSKEIGKYFDKIEYVIQVGDKIAYVAWDNGRKLLSYDGQDVSSGYSYFNNPTSINNKLAFIARKNNKNIVYYDGLELETDKTEPILPGELDPTTLIGVNGKPAYIVKNNDGKTFVIYNNKEIGKEYDNVKYDKYISYGFMSLNNKLIALFEKNGKASVVYDWKQYGGAYDFVMFDDIYGPQIIGDKLAFIAIKNGKRIFVYDGVEMASYDNIVGLLGINNKPAFKAIDEKNGNFIWYDGKELGKEYGDVGIPMNINNNLVFFAVNGINMSSPKAFKHAFFVYGGKEIEVGKNYNLIAKPTNVNGKLAFIAFKGEKAFIVKED